MSEFKEKLNEIMDDLKGRIRNPLILSFILVWLYFHWDLVYQFLTINNTIPIESRLTVFKNYILNEGWNGMIGLPICYAFLSLIAYYLIAIVAQLIKVGGKYLYSSILAKIDPHSFVLRTELEKEIRHVKLLKQQLSSATQENAGLINFKEASTENLNDLRTKNSTLKHELDQALHNINYNLKFRDEFENLILFMFSQKKGLSLKNMRDPEFHKNYYKVTDGNWKILSSDVFSKSSGSALNLTFENDNVLSLDGKQIGTLEGLVYDKRYKFLEFKLRKGQDVGKDSYSLVKINENEMIGFYNQTYVYFERHD